MSSEADRDFFQTRWQENALAVKERPKRPREYTDIPLPPAVFWWTLAVIGCVALAAFNWRWN